MIQVSQSQWLLSFTVTLSYLPGRVSQSRPRLGAAFSGVLAGVPGATAAACAARYLHARTTSSAVIYCCILCTEMFKVFGTAVS